MVNKIKIDKELIKIVKADVQKEINKFGNRFVKTKYHLSDWLIKTVISSYYKCKWTYILNDEDKKGK
jgi:hypothetical protein